ncbi:MAG: HlyD family efflux transporter periplasmic adaptor subunit [Rhizobiaceae bacterium]
MLTRNQSLDKNGLDHGSLRARLGKTAIQVALMLLVLGGGLAGLAALIATKPEVARRPPFPTVYTVETARAVRGDHAPVYSVFGEVVSARSVELRSLVAGEVIAVSTNLKAGASVKRGDALVEIDRFGFEGALREARANLAEAESRIAEMKVRVEIEESRLQSAEDQLELARKDLERIRELRTRGSATDKQLEDRELLVSQRKAAFDQTRIGIAAEKAKLSQQEATRERLAWKVEQAERNLSDTVLSAPFDAIVRSANIESGKMVNANDVVVVLYESGNLEVRFTLTDERFARLQSEPGGFQGRTVQVVWQAGGEIVTVPAVMDRLGADIAASRGGVEVYATMQAGGIPLALRPGAFVEVKVQDRLFANHYRLPAAALYGEDTIYLVRDGGLVRSTVRLAAYDGDDVILSGDLNADDEVLVTHIAEISDGLKVRRVDDPVAGDR